MSSYTKNLVALSLFAAGPMVAAAAGSAASKRSRGRWYRRLRKPPYTPPARALGPVWTGLYASMAASVMRVWLRPPSTKRTGALWLWTAQLGLNAAWSPLFFGLRRPRAALADSGALLATLGAYTACSAKVDKPAAWLVAPYLGWTAFATMLNADIVKRNA